MSTGTPCLEEQVESVATKLRTNILGQQLRLSVSGVVPPGFTTSAEHPDYLGKWDGTGLDWMARDHSDLSDNAEVASSILASPTTFSLIAPPGGLRHGRQCR
jgi:hypothetical protein